MKGRWLVVIAFWTALVIAVATGAQKAGDFVWLIVFLVFALAGTVKTVRDLVRYFRNPEPNKKYFFTGVYPRWFGRFVFDERDEAPYGLGEQPSTR